MSAFEAGDGRVTMQEHRKGKTPEQIRAEINQG